MTHNRVDVALELVVILIVLGVGWYAGGGWQITGCAFEWPVSVDNCGRGAMISRMGWGVATGVLCLVILILGAESDG